ncbi:MAG TPA: class I SAM-dependent methyltransferase [Candidatus Acidoferrales bacterium]|nr:class I SAM-dependent methyltransferase [Candidatus Acidoferrales bacterium]
MISEVADMTGYYAQKLSGFRLKRVYDVAPPRIKQYLDAEVNHVRNKIHADDSVLELGCGYGRILPSLAAKAGWVVGVDTSLPTLNLGQEELRTLQNCSLIQMNALQLSFPDQTFNCVACIQNGISAFHVNQHALIAESIRVTRDGGIVLFSSYSDKFWKDRLSWFELQSRLGLLGEIDYDKTMDGIITCKDGFTATTVSAEDFRTLTTNLNASVNILEVDKSSIFCEIMSKTRI